MLRVRLALEQRVRQGPRVVLVQRVQQVLRVLKEPLGPREPLARRALQEPLARLVLPEPQVQAQQGYKARLVLQEQLVLQVQLE